MENGSESTEKRKLAAVMFTDIKGFSKRMGEDEEGTFKLLKQQMSELKPIIQKKSFQPTFTEYMKQISLKKASSEVIGWRFQSQQIWQKLAVMCSCLQKLLSLKQWVLKRVPKNPYAWGKRGSQQKLGLLRVVSKNLSTMYY